MHSCQPRVGFYYLVLLYVLSSQHHIWVGCMYLTPVGRHIVILCLWWLTAFIKENPYRNLIFMISHSSTPVIPFEIVRSFTTRIHKLLTIAAIIVGLLMLPSSYECHVWGYWCNHVQTLNFLHWQPTLQELKKSQPVINAA